MTSTSKTTLPRNPLALLKPKYLLAGATYALLASGKALAARDSFGPAPAPAPTPAAEPAQPALYCNPLQSPAGRCTLARAAVACPGLAAQNPALDNDLLHTLTDVGGFGPVHGQALCDEVIEAAQDDVACYGPVDNKACGVEQPALSCANGVNQLCALEQASNTCNDVQGMGTAGELAQALATQGGGSEAPVLYPSSTVAATCSSVAKRARQLQALCPPSAFNGFC